MPASSRSLPHLLRWGVLVAVALLLVLTSATFGSGTTRPAAAQTIKPPGPLLATGDYLSPDVDLIEGFWEAFPADNALGHVLYIWEGPSWVSRAFPCPATTVTTPCYNWIQYILPANVLAAEDGAYDTSVWIPFQRGCMLLGANPVVALVADGLWRTTDVYVAGDVWNPDLSSAAPVGFLNPVGSGIGSVTDVTALDAACAGGPSGPATGGICAQFTLSGVWRATQANNYSPTFTFSQSGTSLSGTATLPGNEQARAGFRSSTGQITGSLVGTALDFTVTWQGPNGAIVGRYTGTVSQGDSAGTGQVRNGNAGGVSWSGSGPAACAGGSSGGGQPSTCSWAGTWRTPSEPDLVLTQSGNQVTGTFGFHGPVQGTVAGDTLTATTTDGRGNSIQLQLRMDTSIDSFTGQHRPAPAGLTCQIMSGTVGTLPKNFSR